MTSRDRHRRRLAKTLHTVRGIREREEKANRFASSTASDYADVWHSQKAPGSNDLIQQYTGTAGACAHLNAQAVARVPRRLYVQTPKGGPAPKYWVYKAVEPHQERWVRERAKAAGSGIRPDAEISEVLEHPLLTLLESAAAPFGPFSLAELTDLYQEVEGNAYWHITKVAGLEVPAKITLLQSQLVGLERDDATGLITHYTYGDGEDKQRFPAADVVHFKFPSLADPYGLGWSPLRSCWESVNILAKDHAYIAASMDNRARPDAIVSPKSTDDFMIPGQEKRLERILKRKFRRAGSGGIAVWGQPLDFHPLTFNSRDMEMLARYGVTKVEVQNAFDVPPALLDSMKSRAELDAAKAQHGSQAISPRVLRADEVINTQLASLFSDRLFVMSDDCVKEDIESTLKKRETNLRLGVTVINEERLEEGKEEVDWGKEPWLANTVSQPSERPEPTPPGEMPPGGPPPAPGEEPEPDDGNGPKPMPDEEDDEKGIPAGKEALYRNVLVIIRRHPNGLDAWDIAEELGNDTDLVDVTKAATYWKRMGLIR